MPATPPISIGMPTAWRRMGLLVTTSEVHAMEITSEATKEAEEGEKENLPVGEVNSRTRVDLTNRGMTQCGHTVGTLTLPVAAPPRTAQRSIRAAREWGVA